MSFKVIFFIILFVIGMGWGYYGDKIKKAKIRQKSGCLTEEDKKILKWLGFFTKESDDKKSTNNLIVLWKKHPILGILVLLFVGFGTILGIADFIDEHTYKEFSSPSEIRELKNMNCVDLIAKNLGVEREFCGYVDDESVLVYKKDLYNKTSKHCYNLYNLSEVSGDLVCFVPISDTLNNFTVVPNNGIYRFKGIIKRNVHPSYYYSITWPQDVSPADKRTRERMGR